MTDVRRLWPFAAVILLALTAEHALGLGTKALAFVHEGWLAAFLDSALIRAFCL
jgi:acyl-coenzyme A thioesterase PaaI-like protein